MSSPKPLYDTAPDIRELLQTSKAPRPPTEDQLKILRAASSLDVSDYSEMDVRAEIIDPVLRVLGYAKETNFSVQRDTSLTVLGATITPDYRLTLFEDDFWVIEAKKPVRKALGFTHKELRQALEYASHPKINAALVVLCDGRLFEIYDREHSVDSPAARVEVSRLAEDFETLQVWLAPWQAWFFQKRRVLRLMNRVLTHEVLPGRLVELQKTINGRLANLQVVARRNWQKAHDPKADRFEREARLRGETATALIEAEFFYSNMPVQDFRLITDLVAEKTSRGGFEVLHSLFPDRPRLINDAFLGCSLLTLIKLENKSLDISWVPSWLGGETKDLSLAIKTLISLCLDTFNKNPERKIVLQYSACARRTAKIFAAVIPGINSIGEQRHDLFRWLHDELHFSQYVSTPAGHTLQHLNELQLAATQKFLEDCRTEHGDFDTLRAKKQLQDAWKTEARLLKDGREFLVAVKAIGLGEMFSGAWVSFDFLGHLVLCVLKMAPRQWRDYAMEAHLDSIRRLAAGGSHEAAELLGTDKQSTPAGIHDAELAERFFYGDLALFQHLKAAYSNHPV